VQVFYAALRRLGLDVDIVPVGADLAAYDLVAVPTLPHVSDEALRAFEGCRGGIVFGPRSGSKTQDYQIPLSMPPGPLQRHLPLRVHAVESLRPEIADTLAWKGGTYRAGLWRDYAEADLDPEASFSDGEGAVWRNGNWHYVAHHPDEEFLIDYFEHLAQERGLQTTRLPALVRLRRRGSYTFAFNYGTEPFELSMAGQASFILGSSVLHPRDVAVWDHTGTRPRQGTASHSGSLKNSHKHEEIA
jgi:beta-galactosidase